MARAKEAERTVEIAVVGAGRWGALHAVKLASLGLRPWVVDRVPRRAERVAARVGGGFARDVAALPASVRAATVAVDIDQLAGVTEVLLQRGLHVLVEKPAARDAAALARLMSQAADRVFAVGFLERFNPALIAQTIPVRNLVARRLGPEGPSDHLGLDWLVHDIDLARHLTGADLAVTRCRRHARRIHLRLESPGVAASLTACSDAPHVARRLWLDGARADLLAGGDALLAQLRAFVEAIQGRPDPRLAGAADALAALRILAEAQALTRRAAA